ncbi:hypothetical protein [Methyloceanibacter caenitepidi]|uniref:Uncharacterized protein n=1 Tax=Methyloceanibacter caenitepidi TaxID=1384459 RepID=A0A0A8K1V5_9HYPH|nr:hypothetical protein [Methyloceanibacter caenitepidi]BAQ16933.1 hypothetical protein GL4_1477 [Methyloceanibacter caenitepidi]
MTRQVSDSAALEILERLETNAHHYAYDWRPLYRESAGQYLLVQAESAEGATIETGSDPHLRDALKLLLENAHTLIALARLGIERVHAADQMPRLEWPPRHCRACGSTRVFVHRKMHPDPRRAAYGVECKACGHEGTELGPPAAPPEDLNVPMG